MLVCSRRVKFKCNHTLKTLDFFFKKLVLKLFLDLICAVVTDSNHSTTGN